jgi:hypothetical protein
VNLASNVTPARAWITEQDAPRFRVPQRMQIGLLQRLAGAFYSAAAPGEIREVADRLEMGSTSWWRRASGAYPTPLSRAGEEELRFRRAGYDTAFFPAYLATVGLLPALERMTVDQINEALIEAHAEEDATNALLNAAQIAHLSVGRTCFFTMAQAAIQQQKESGRIAHLALRLHLLTGGRA